ncbi:hypothetical protein DNTS_006138, partial [Danionella cerebrum]
SRPFPLTTVSRARNLGEVEVTPPISLRSRVHRAEHRHEERETRNFKLNISSQRNPRRTRGPERGSVCLKMNWDVVVHLSRTMGCRSGCCCVNSPGSVNEDNARFLLLALLIVIYLLCGAAVFSSLEQPMEKLAKEKWTQRMEQFTVEHNLSREDLKRFLRSYEEANLAGIRVDATRPRWDFAGAFYFVGTVVSTIGFGMTTPVTIAGKIFLIFYGLVGCASTILFFNLFLERVITVIAFVLKFCHERRELHKSSPAQNSHRHPSAGNRDRRTDSLAGWKPSVYCVMLILGGAAILVSCSASAMYSSAEGWDYLDALYFCFVAFSTIGFGDMVSNQREVYKAQVAYRVGNFLFIVTGVCCIYSLFNVISIVIKQVLNWLLQRLEAPCQCPGQARRNAIVPGHMRSRRENSIDTEVVNDSEADGRRMSGEMISMKDFLAANKVNLAIMQKQLSEMANGHPRQSGSSSRHNEFSGGVGALGIMNNRLAETSGQSQSGGHGPGGGKKDDKDKKKKYEPPIPTRVGKKKRKTKGPDAASKLPLVTPHTQCRLKLLKQERIKDYLLMEEEFIRNQEQMKPLEEKQEEERSKVDDLRGTPMSVGNLEEIIDDNHAIVSTSVGSEHYVSILSFVDKDLLEPGCSVLLNHKVHAVIGVLMDDTDPLVTVMKESVELPLTHPEYYEEMGIKPPKGVILYGPPGTGKTLLAKAVANQTSATFLRVVGSELIQKYLGDGPKLVRELFRVAEEHAPSIVFIDEIDAIGTKRYDSNSGGEREIQRTMLELLNQLDGFDSRGDVKVIMATNRIETLDPALIRPGRIDRKIEFPLPDEKTKRRIFQIHTSRMTVAEDVTLDDLILAKDDLSGADIKAICTEAGLMALRERRMKVTNEDFKKSKENVLYKKQEGTPEGLYL